MSFTDSDILSLLQAHNYKPLDIPIHDDAVEALRELRGRPMVEQLSKLIYHKNEGLSLAAIKTLRDLGDSSAIPALVQFCYSYVPKNQYYALDNRVEAIEALAKLGAVEPLISMLSKCDGMQILIAENLAKLGDSRAVQPLIDMMSQGNVEIKKIVIGYLGYFKDDNAVSALLNTLDHPEWTIRHRAVLALESIGDKRATIPLIKALSDSSFYVQSMAVRALGKFRDHQAVPPLISLLSDKEIWLRAEAIKALCRIGDTNALCALKNVLLEPDQPILDKGLHSLAEGAIKELERLRDKEKK